MNRDGKGWQPATGWNDEVVLRCRVRYTCQEQNLADTNSYKSMQWKWFCFQLTLNRNRQFVSIHCVKFNLMSLTITGWQAIEMLLAFFLMLSPNEFETKKKKRRSNGDFNQVLMLFDRLCSRWQSDFDAIQQSIVVCGSPRIAIQTSNQHTPTNSLQLWIVKSSAIEL